MTTINFNRLPPEIQVQIFSLAIATDIPSTAKFAAVCPVWNRVMADDMIWKPIFSCSFEDLAMKVDFSSAQPYKERVKLVWQEMQNVQHHCGYRIPSQILKKDNDVTQLLETMIQQNQFERLAFCLLFKPHFNANRIARLLYQVSPKQSKNDADADFCLELLIKSHYDLSRFFSETWDLKIGPCKGEGSRGQSINRMLNNITIRLIDGIRVIDYTQSGLKLSAYQTDNSSLFHELLTFITSCYRRDRFSLPAPKQPRWSILSFSNNKLREARSKDRFSEEELQQMIRDVLFSPELNLRERQWSKDGKLLTTLSFLKERHPISEGPKLKAVMQALISECAEQGWPESEKEIQLLQ